jgi:hypothetical protein
MVAAWTNQSIVLYHGTSLPQAQDIVHGVVRLSAGKAATDFGRGFDTTTNLRQARVHSKMRAKSREMLPAVAEITVPREELASLHGLAFVLGDPSAADFWSLIDFCRTGIPGHGRTGAAFYDVVFGPVTSNYRERRLHLGFDQISFHTDQAIELLNRPRRRKII